MAHPRKGKTPERKGKTPIYFLAPTELADEYRKALNGEPFAQDLRRYMAERIKEAA